MGIPSGPAPKNPAAMQETQKTQVWFLGWEDPLEAGMVTHSSILTRRSPWTEEPSGLQSMDSPKSQTWLSDSTTTTKRLSSTSHRLVVGTRWSCPMGSTFPACFRLKYQGTHNRNKSELVLIRISQLFQVTLFR